MLKDEGRLLKVFSCMEGTFGEQIPYLDSSGLVFLVNQLPLCWRYRWALTSFLIFFKDPLHIWVRRT